MIVVYTNGRASQLALQRSEKKMDDPDATMKINQL